MTDPALPSVETVSNALLYLMTAYQRTQCPCVAAAKSATSSTWPRTPARRNRSACCAPDFSSTGVSLRAPAVKPSSPRVPEHVIERPAIAPSAGCPSPCASIRRGNRSCTSCRPRGRRDNSRARQSHCKHGCLDRRLCSPEKLGGYQNRHPTLGSPNRSSATPRAVRHSFQLSGGNTRRA
jgi:hypothetical protein